MRGALAFGRFLRQQRIQIVQTFFESSDIWAGSVARVLSPAKLIWSRRDMGILRGRKHAAAYRLLRRLPHAVFAVSQQVHRYVLEADHVSPQRVHTIYNGLEVGPSTSPKRSGFGSPVHITTVGNIRRVKGHDLLVSAAAQVIARFPNTRFSVAGEVLEAAYVEELRVSVAALGLTGHFSFLGKLTDMESHLASADIFVLPSRSEGFSNALVEAMAAGLPCVAAAVGGNAEALQNRTNGLIVPPEDVSALAGALMELLGAPEQALAMGEAAQHTVVQRFTADAMMEHIAGHYHAILNR